MRAVVSFLVIALAACSSQKPVQRADDAAAVTEHQMGQPHAPITTGPRVILSSPRGDLAVHVDVVSSEPALMKGLMYRQLLPADDGMLFYMHEERDWTFYMRNTLIPLDMIFIGKDMTVAGIFANATPLTEELRSVGKPSLYVLEVNGGWCARHGVAAGAKVQFVETEAAAR
ncbi:MAG: DUF192 domain-containing protein [Proteobacteria bacterium]|nr:DUF192 domain-containing protein [Pseudomonadota bacterium]